MPAAAVANVARGIVRFFVAALREVDVAGHLVAVGRRLVAVGRGLVAVSRALVGVGESLLAVSMRLDAISGGVAVLGQTSNGTDLVRVALDPGIDVTITWRCAAHGVSTLVNHESQ